MVKYVFVTPSACGAFMMTGAEKNLWNVPEVCVGKHLVPRLFLGDHGFLKLYGSRLRFHDIYIRMKYGLSHASLGLAAGDIRCLRAARKAFEDIGRHQKVLYHTDIRLCQGKKRLHFERMLNQLRIALAERGEFDSQDPIVGQYLSMFADYQPYSAIEMASLAVESDWLEEEIGIIKEFRPTVVSVGGDYLDFAVAINKTKLLIDPLEQLRATSHKLGASFIITLYLAMQVLEANLLPITDYDGIMIPWNPSGYAMIPDRERLENELNKISIPKIAMHVIGAGKIGLETGLSYVFSKRNASVAVIGASQYAHIQELISLAPNILGNAT